MAKMNSEQNNGPFFETIKHFPPVLNGKINIVQFIDSTSGLITLVERLGKVFAPVKYDMEGNLQKIIRNYQYNDESCLLELMLNEISNENQIAAEGVLWLNRALLFFELVFAEIIKCLQTKNHNGGLKRIFTVAYEGSVKKYHNWVTQQIFNLISKMSPTLPQIMDSLEVEDVRSFEIVLSNFNNTLHLVRVKIDDFFKEYNLFPDPKL